MAHPMGKIMTVMARTASSNTKSSGKRSAGKARSGETKVMDTVEPSPVMGVLTKYRRDIACFVLVILAVLFCASEWFRVQGAFGQVLHAMASGLFGLMSVILPVFLMLVVFSLMHKTQRKSDNARMATGWSMILWSICSILDAALASDIQGFDMALLQKAGGLLGYVLGCPLAWGLSKAFAIVIFVVVMFVNMLLKVFFGILEQKETLHDRPLKGLLQILQVGLFFLAAIVVTSLLIGRSPLKLLAGLGASAAILMLIFKDTIMGFVAGVMLSANKMLRPGDWISMPKYNVDGTVLEVTLNTVKIQNFDNTVTTVPPFILTGDSFQNWRWMQESGGRRIMRSINIDLGSVRFCTPEMTEKYKDIELLHDYVVQRETEFDRYRNGAENPNGADFFRLTNLTVFRAYLNLYLKKLAVVNHELTCMVRHLQPTPNGIPVEVYCFSVIKEWVAYESVQADLFDHIIAVVPEFDLVLFQNPSGNDIQRIFRPARNVAVGA